MKLSPWAVVSWPVVEWYIPKQRSKWPPFSHGVTGAHRDDAACLHRGTSLWIGMLDNQSIGLAWDWVEVRGGVVALIDPNGICSNLRLLHDQDHGQSELATCLSLYRLVHGLDWQPAAVAAIRKAQASSQLAQRPTAGVAALNAELGFSPTTRLTPALSAPVQQQVAAGC